MSVPQFFPNNNTNQPYSSNLQSQSDPSNTGRTNPTKGTRFAPYTRDSGVGEISNLLRRRLSNLNRTYFAESQPLHNSNNGISTVQPPAEWAGYYDTKDHHSHPIIAMPKAITTNPTFPNSSSSHLPIMNNNQNSNNIQTYKQGSDRNNYDWFLQRNNYDCFEKPQPQQNLIPPAAASYQRDTTLPTNVAPHDSSTSNEQTFTECKLNEKKAGEIDLQFKDLHNELYDYVKKNKSKNNEYINDALIDVANDLIDLIKNNRDFSEKINIKTKRALSKKFEYINTLKQPNVLLRKEFNFNEFKLKINSTMKPIYPSYKIENFNY